MKTKVAVDRPGMRRIGVLESFTTNQLAWIGAIAMMYNDTETELNELFGVIVDFPGQAHELSSRINGTDGLCELIKLGVAALGFDDDFKKEVELTIGSDGFSQLKSWRDAVMHAKLFDMSTAVGIASARRGKLNYVLLTEDALEGLYHRLFSVADEINEIREVVSNYKILKSDCSSDDQHREQLERAIRDGRARVRSHRSHRRSLPPMPTLPDAPLVLSLYQPC